MRDLICAALLLAVMASIWGILCDFVSQQLSNTVSSLSESPRFSKCDLIPYDLTVEHLASSSSSSLSQRDWPTIDPESPHAPRFSFKASSATTPSLDATASHVQVLRCLTKDCQDTQIVWDSGWILAGRKNGLDITPHRQLDGLVPMELLQWRARFGIHDNYNNNDDGDDKQSAITACPWSDYESFLVGPSQQQWDQAEWMCAPNAVTTECDFYDSHGKAAAPLFRTEFTIHLPGHDDEGTVQGTSITHSIASARLFVTGLGNYEAWMNGVHVNHGRFLDPAPASYNKRVFYNSFDVTDMLDQDGRHQALGFIVGNGWFNPLPMKFWGQLNIRQFLTVGSPRIKAILQIVFADPHRRPLVLTTSVTSTNTSVWKTTNSSLLRNDLYLGNVVDLDLAHQLEGWSQVGFDNPVIEWQPVSMCSHRLELPRPIPQPIPPIRSRPPHRLHFVSRSKIDNDWVLDMGLNTAAVVEVDIFVPHDWVCSPQEIELKFGELLYPDGTVNVMTSVAGQINKENCCGECAPPVAYQRLVLRTSKSSHFTTQFSWSAFRYIQISSLPPGWDINVTAIPVMTDLKWISSFQSSNPLINDIVKLCQNTHASNMMGIQSDCPHRERFGYTGDALATMPTSLAFFDGSAFFEKRLYDMHDSLRVNGGVTETAPFVGISAGGLGKRSGPIGWQSFFPHVQIALHQYFANTQALADMLNATRQWINLVLSHPLQVERGLGDWMATDYLPVIISGHVFVIEALRAWSVLTDSDVERERSIKRAQEELDQFVTRFVSGDTGDVKYNASNVTQSGQAMAIFYDLVPESLKHLVASSLIRTVAKSDYHITTGMFGVLPVLESLTMINKSDLAWKMVTQKTFPSYGYMIENNATTLWESWFFSNSRFSHNHPMFSGVSSWIMTHIGGIQVAKDAIGADRLIFAPNPPLNSGLFSANYTLETARGRASCKWQCLPNGAMKIEIECPVNTRGRVVLPDGSDPFNVSGGHYHYMVSAVICQNQPSTM